MSWIRHLHSKNMHFTLLFLGIVLTEGYLSFRAAGIAYSFFIPYGAIEAFGAAIFVFLATWISGTVIASQREKNYWLIIAVLLADWGGILYLVYKNTNGIQWPLNTPQAAIALSFCALTTLPFGMGEVMNKIQPHLQAEINEDHNERVTRFRFMMEREAMNAIQSKAKKDPVYLEKFLPKELVQNNIRLLDEYTQKVPPENITIQVLDNISEKNSSSEKTDEIVSFLTGDEIKPQGGTRSRQLSTIYAPHQQN